MTESTLAQSAAREGTFELHAGAMRLALRADLGGCIAGLWHHDVPVMRSTEPRLLDSVRLAGCFPMVPYQNRLGYRRFRWHGKDYTTEPNFGASPHSLHGLGWQRPWELQSHSAFEAVLRLEHHADAHWPFDFEAIQHFSLTQQALKAQMVLTNTGSISQPAGIGWHPYFPKRQRSRLHIELSDRWESDANELPTRKVAQPGIDNDVAYLAFDNCFEGWKGPARIRDERFSLQLSSSLPYLVVYTPPEHDFFCVEPASHVSNAIHMADPAAHGLRSLEPGEAMEASMTLAVSVL